MCNFNQTKEANIRRKVLLRCVGIAVRQT